eukprot:3494168-Pleurochrysis_carterae.AAC.1
MRTSNVRWSSVRIRAERAERLFVVRVHWQELWEELVSVMLTIEFELKVLFGFRDLAVALLHRGRSIVVSLGAIFRLDSVLVEAIHLPACHRVDVPDDVRPAAVKWMRFAGVIAPVY